MKNLFITTISFLLMSSSCISQIDMTSITDVCEDDTPFNIAPITPVNLNSGKCGVAVFMITPDDVSASTIDFVLENFNGVEFMNETNIPGVTYPLQPNSLYMLYDNPCFDVSDAGLTPEFLWITDDIPQQSSTIDGCGYYIYYYAHDAIEVINNRASTYNSSDPNTWMGYYYDPSDPNGLGNVPSFYTANTWKRQKTIWTTSSKKIIFPQPSSYQYFGYGEWSGQGITSSGATVPKDYWAGYPDHAGLIRTVDIPTGEAQFDPSSAPIGPNLPLTYTYNSVMGVNGPAPCNVQTITNTELDVHALPTITPVADQLCNGATYSVTLNVDLDTYNVSVDEDGGTPFNISGTGGVVSPISLSGTGINQVTISDIPTGTPWSLDITDLTGLNCGLTGTNGTCLTVLPIELISFTGEKNNRYNILYWETVSEQNNDYFILERSIDGINFEPLFGTVDGAGNSNQKLDYSKIDYNPFQVSYYRLIQVDFNGEYSYSNVIVLKREIENEGVSVYPNPTTDKLTLTLNKITGKNIELTIVNSIGQEVMVQTITNDNDLLMHNLSIGSLRSGVYLVNVRTDSNLYSERIIKL